jgi:hypothetical protein
LFDGLRKYDATSVFNPDKKLLGLAVDRTKRMLRIAEGSLTPAVEDLVISKLKKQHSSGAPHFIKKEEALELERQVEERLLEPCVAYHRTQNRYDDGTFQKKVRLVWGYPMEMTILEGKYAIPVLDALKSMRTPIALGLRKSELAATLYPLKHDPVVGTFDWSGFDSTIPAQLISISFKIVKSWFGDVDMDEWNEMVKYFIHTPILMPDGYVYKGKSRGIPSGSYFTSIIGSIVNLIVINYLCALQGLKVKNINVLGDDSIVGLYSHLDVNRMGLEAKAHFGMSLKPEKQRYTKSDHEIVFLSHVWIRGRAHRPVVVSAAKLVFPERGFQRNIDMRELRASRICQSYADNPAFWENAAEALRALNIPYSDYAKVKTFSRKMDGSDAIYVPLALATLL